MRKVGLSSVAMFAAVVLWIHSALFWQIGTVKYSGGTGEAGNPWRIAEAIDLIALGDNTGDYSGCFVLTGDIDLTGYGPFEKALIGYDTSSDYNFQGNGFGGVFDGRIFIGRQFTLFEYFFSIFSNFAVFPLEFEFYFLLYICISFMFSGFIPQVKRLQLLFNNA